MSRNGTKIIFLNQMAGPLFRELAEDVSRELGTSILYTGHPHTADRPGSGNLIVLAGPEYDRQSNLKRLVSWLRYFARALFITWKEPDKALLFIVSNPPFLGLAGFFLKLLRGQKYIILVYDVYPDILIALGRLKEGIIPRFWRFLNRLILGHAALVFAISRDMADLLEQRYDLRHIGTPIVIPNWADITYIRPIEKKDNWFAARHNQTDKTTILYSGNMGNTHDIESIISAARKLHHHKHIHFLFIGEGAKRILVEKATQNENLTNITLLPFQPEEVLPYSIATGDIGIVAYSPGTEGCIVPSKTYYYMAAGVAPLILCSRETDLSRMVIDHNCGLVVKNGDIDNLAQGILKMSRNAILLSDYKNRARTTAERFFSRENTALFTKAIKARLRREDVTTRTDNRDRCRNHGEKTL